MKRRKSSSGGGSNWMDTYGDMVTLLLCFFVLLYSMSNISQEKWQAIVQSFNPYATETPTETSGSDGPVADPSEDGTGLDKGLSPEEVEAQMLDLYEALKDYVDREGAQDSISVTMGDGKVFISFNQTVFFDGNSSVLREDAYPILNYVSVLFSEASQAI